MNRQLFPARWSPSPDYRRTFTQRHLWRERRAERFCESRRRIIVRAVKDFRSEKTIDQKPSSSQVKQDIVPKLKELTDDVLFGVIWKRPGLSPRDRSLATVAALIVLNRTEQLPFHLRRALANGLQREELAELITHLAFYGGWPVAVSAVTVLREVLTSKE